MDVFCQGHHGEFNGELDFRTADEICVERTEDMVSREIVPGGVLALCNVEVLQETLKS